MPKTASRAATTDGRVLRSERSRETIARAVFELVGEGNPQPTAQQIAERADVGTRTVFRHFADMEALYATVDARLLAEIAPMLERTPTPGSRLNERVVELVADRAEVFERIAPYKRSSNWKRGRSPYLDEQHRKLVRELRERLVRWLPELRSAESDLVEALDQATSFEAWDRLRTDQRLGQRRARAAMQRAVEALVRQMEEIR